MNKQPTWQYGCPVNLHEATERIQLAHGEGARLTRRLIEKIILPKLKAESSFADAAAIDAKSNSLVVATDSHTVWPLFFPGGDIGSLSVYGTVNDLTVAGSVPAWLTLGLIIEEGFPVTVLERILDSIAAAADGCRVRIVTGDTKVVPCGAADGLFINTTGIGQLRDNAPPGPAAIRAGDRIIVSGPIGRHGIAILAARGALDFAESPESDSASLFEGVEMLLHSTGQQTRCIRDATRGGVSAVLHEWAAETGVSFELDESLLSVTPDVRGACELLGLDPLYIANEGVFVAVVSPHCADAAVRSLQQVSITRQAAVVGTVTDAGICPVTVRRALGTPQPLDEPSGAPLPRIC